MATSARPVWVDTTPLTSRIYDLIAEFLSKSDRKAYRVAVSLTSLFEPFTTTLPETKHLNCLWGAIFWTASTFHPGADEHFRLIDLVCQIQRIPGPNGDGIEQDGERKDHGKWSDLPGWWEVWADFENDAPLTPRMIARRGGRKTNPTKSTPGPWRKQDGTSMSSSTWANLNAFAAKLQAQTDIDFLSLIGLFSCLEALEEDVSSMDLDNVVPAAACWILSAGTDIWESSEGYDTNHDEPDATKKLPISRGSLYEGERGFSAERWAFWKSRFGILSKRNDLSQNTRVFASQAMNEMKCIETRR